VVTEMKYPASSHYSDRYQRELSRIWLDIATDLKRGVPTVTLLQRARSGYAAAWEREMFRYRETRAHV